MPQDKMKWPEHPVFTSIYRESNAVQIQPRCIYFNHCLADETIKTYFVERSHPITDIKREIDDILKSVDQLTPLDPPINWNIISYFVIALEGPEKLIPGAAFEIVYMDGEKPFPNHAFFDGGDIDLKGATAAYAINYMIKRGGGALKKSDSKEHFAWRTYHSATRAVRFHDDSGNNIPPTAGP